MIINLLTQNVNLSYIGFEPQVAGAYYIQELIRANRLTRHHFLAIALGAEDKAVTLYTQNSVDVTATYKLSEYSPQRYSETVLVPVSTADAQLATLEEDIFLVKLDTEGSEMEVLQGMNRIIQEKRVPVYFEAMGYRSLVEDTYSREFNNGELSDHERRRLIENRKANMEILGKFWREHGYTTHLCRDDGTLLQVQSLDPGPQSDDNRGEMNYLALPV